jgi:hypothetical protein
VQAPFRVEGFAEPEQVGLVRASAMVQDEEAVGVAVGRSLAVDEIRHDRRVARDGVRLSAMQSGS